MFKYDDVERLKNICGLQCENSLSSLKSIFDLNDDELSSLIRFIPFKITFLQFLEWFEDIATLEIQNEIRKALVKLVGMDVTIFC